mgnify:CR=1 FL=1
MTGTARPARRELKRVYKLPMVVIPTNKPCIRQGLPTRVFATLEAKWKAVARSAKEMVAKGRAVLIGTPSVEASIGLSEILRETGVTHRVLNAYRHAEESEIVAQAGQPGKVTVSTNMAGRGTDILLEDSVRQAGGLHVIATEMHSSKRIDRQLVGRAARQGDPGGFQFFLSLEDELLRCLTPEKAASVRRSAFPDKYGELSGGWLRFFRKTQRYLERLHYKQRRDMLKQDKHRSQQYRRMGLDPCLELTEN